MDLKAAAIFNSYAIKLAVPPLMPHQPPALNSHPFGLNIARHNGRVGSCRTKLGLDIRRREHIAAVRTFAQAGMDDRFTLRAGFNGCRACAVRWLFDMHRIDRPMSLDVTGEVQNEAVTFVGRNTHAPAEHLHVKSSAQRRSEHSNYI